MNHARHTHIQREIEKLKKAYDLADDEDTKITIEDKIDAYEIELLTMPADDEEYFQSSEYREVQQQQSDDNESSQGEY